MLESNLGLQSLLTLSLFFVFVFLNQDRKVELYSHVKVVNLPQYRFWQLKIKIYYFLSTFAMTDF